MRVSIVQIADRGVPNQERLHLRVQVETNLAYFVIFDTERRGIGVVPVPKHAYWFVDKPVKAGDDVIIYTGRGQNQSLIRKDGNYNHFFYWGLLQTLWKDPNACAVVLEVSEWATSA